jgi:hypothetical protein
VLRAIKAVLEKHNLTIPSLRAESAGRPEYTISTFSERHGTRGDVMADEIAKIPEKLYTEPNATENAYALIEAFVAEHFDNIVSRLEEISA